MLPDFKGHGYSSFLLFILARKFVFVDRIFNMLNIKGIYQRLLNLIRLRSASKSAFSCFQISANTWERLRDIG